MAEITFLLEERLVAIRAEQIQIVFILRISVGIMRRGVSGRDFGVAVNGDLYGVIPRMFSAIASGEVVYRWALSELVF